MHLTGTMFRVKKKEDFKMLLYLDGKDLLVFCETSEAEEKANMILHTMTGEEGVASLALQELYVVTCCCKEVY